MATPEVSLVGTTTNLTGTTFTVGIDVPVGSIILIPYDGTGTLSISDSKGNSYAGDYTIARACERVTTALAAGDTINLSFTQDTTNYTGNFFWAWVYVLTHATTRPSTYGISDAGSPVYYYEGTNFGATSGTPEDYSYSAAVTSYLTGRGITLRRVKNYLAVYLSRVRSINSFVNQPSDMQGSDGFTALYAGVDVSYHINPTNEDIETTKRGAYRAGSGTGDGVTASGTRSLATTGETAFYQYAYLVFFNGEANLTGKLSHAFLAPTGRRFVGAINDSGQAIIYLDDTLAATTETGTVVVVDSATTCVSPSVHVTPDGRVHYVYGRDGNSYYRYSKDAGKTWSTPMLISTGKTIPDHGWNDLVPAVALYNESDSTFYISTGSTDASGAITWNAPVSTGITGLEVSPSLLCRPDGVWELVYQDNTGIQIKRCRNLRANGTGTWS